MSTTPPPFGDPTRVNSENARAIGKGIGIGCGGCLAIAALIIAVAVGIVALVFFAIRSNDAVKIAFKRAQDSPEVIQALGQPLEMGWFVTGSTNSTNALSTAKVNVPISGPKGEGTLFIEGTAGEDEVWNFTVMEVGIDGGSRISLLTDQVEAPLQTPGNSAK
jgi:hypothetical protein